MKNISRHTNEGTSFSAKESMLRATLHISPHLIASRSMLQNGFWTAYGNFLFAGPAVWRGRKHALFPRVGTGKIFKDLL